MQTHSDLRFPKISFAWSRFRRFCPILILLLIGVLLGTGCASTGATGKKEAANIQMPGTGQSRVVFVRPITAGTAVTFNLHEQEQLIGVLPYKSYFVYDCKPGRHRFSTSMEDVAILDADLAPDRIYYALVLPAAGWFIAQVDMYSLHPNSNNKVVKKYWKQLPKTLTKLRETEVTAAEREEDLKGITKYKERIEKYYHEKYLTNPKREQILPEHGQLEPVRAP